MKGPLSLLKETWECDLGRGESSNVVSDVIQMHEKLHKMNELVHMTRQPL